MATCLANLQLQKRHDRLFGTSSSTITDILSTKAVPSSTTSVLGQYHQHQHPRYSSSTLWFVPSLNASGGIIINILGNPAITSSTASLLRQHLHQHPRYFGKNIPNSLSAQCIIITNIRRNPTSTASVLAGSTISGSTITNRLYRLSTPAEP